jgi:hypothetical protein
MKRILLASILGGIIIFVWGGISHMVLPVGEMGMSSLPNEDAVLESFKTNVPDAGLYFFPGWDWGKDVSAEKEAAWTEKHKTGPAGLLIYRPKGGEPMPPTMLISEFGTNFIAALIAALMAASLVGSYFKRALLLSLFGLFAWFAVSASYWIWYSFPASFILAEGIDVYVGALLAGFLIARIVPAPARETKPLAG